MTQPPQNYDLTAFSTTVLLFIAALFFWLCTKMIVSVVRWLIGSSDVKDSVKTNSKEIQHDDNGDQEELEDDDDEDEEMPELETKKGN